jgi:hypothetical protein
MPDLESDFRKLTTDARQMAEENARLRKINSQMISALEYVLVCFNRGFPRRSISIGLRKRLRRSKMRSPKQSATESKQSYGYETSRGGEPVTVMLPNSLMNCRLSFPKIISGRIDDVVRPRRERRQRRQTVGWLDARAHLSVMPSACEPDCNRPHTRKEFAVGVPRRR